MSCKDTLNATAAGALDAFANVHVLRAFGFQVSEGHLWGELELANQNASVNIVADNGDVELAVNSAHAALCPLSSQNHEKCLYFSNSYEDTGRCNLNLSVDGRLILRDTSSRHEDGFAQFSQHLLHNETLNAVAALGAAVQGTSYVVLTSGNPRKTAFLKPPSAVRYVVLPSDSFAGASNKGNMGDTIVQGYPLQDCKTMLCSTGSAGEFNDVFAFFLLAVLFKRSIEFKCMDVKGVTLEGGAVRLPKTLPTSVFEERNLKIHS